MYYYVNGDLSGCRLYQFSEEKELRPWLGEDEGRNFCGWNDQRRLLYRGNR